MSAVATNPVPAARWWRSLGLGPTGQFRALHGLAEWVQWVFMQPRSFADALFFFRLRNAVLRASCNAAHTQRLFLGFLCLLGRQCLFTNIGLLAYLTSSLTCTLTELPVFMLLAAPHFSFLGLLRGLCWLALCSFVAGGGVGLRDGKQ